MADVTVVSPVVTQIHQDCWNRGLVAVSSSVMYFFWSDADALSEVRYVKTLDGGQTWGGPVTVHAHNSAVEILRMDVWYDKWSPNAADGTLIHIVFSKGDNINTPRGWYHYSLDTDNDNLSSEHVIDADIIPVHVGVRHQLTITKAGNGALVVCTTNAGVFNVYSSATDGVGWAHNIVNSDSVSNVPDEYPPINVRQLTLLPGFFDNRPLLLMRDHQSIVMLEFFPGLADFSATAIVAENINLTTVISPGMTAVQRADDRAVIIAWTDDEAPDNFLQSAIMLDASSVTVNLVEFTPNTTFFRTPILYLDNVNGNVYLGYVKGTSDMKEIYWRVSANGGFNWSGEVQFSDVTDDYLFLTGSYSNINTEGLLLFVYHNTDTQDFLTDDTTPPTTGPFGVGDPTQQVPVSCLTGNPF